MKRTCRIRVASFTDAWIETVNLKYRHLPDLVASFTDAWIETKNDNRPDACRLVASFTDAWIETTRSICCFIREESHLLQMRGLKL